VMHTVHIRWDKKTPEHTVYAERVYTHYCG
jgi:hypothetical protein